MIEIELLRAMNRLQDLIAEQTRVLKHIGDNLDLLADPVLVIDPYDDEAVYETIQAWKEDYGLGTPDLDEE